MTSALLAAVVLFASPEKPTAVEVYLRAPPQAAISGSSKIALTNLLGRFPVEYRDATQLKAQLDAARDLEANFNSLEARVVRRRVIAAYGALHRIKKAHVAVVTRAFADELQALLDDNKEFERVATELLRRFPNSRPDPGYYSPPVLARLEDVRARGSNLKTGELIVEANSARVFLDGRSLGVVKGVRRFEVPAGEYCIWAQKGKTFSFSRKIVVGPSASKQRFDVDAEARLNLRRVIEISCPAECAPLLARVGKLLGVERLLLLSDGAAAEIFDVASRRRHDVDLDLVDSSGTWSGDQALTAAFKQDNSLWTRWWVWVGAGVVVAGAVTAALLLRSQDGTEVGTIEVELPDPLP